MVATGRRAFCADSRDANGVEELEELEEELDPYVLSREELDTHILSRNSKRPRNINKPSTIIFL